MDKKGDTFKTLAHFIIMSWRKQNNIFYLHMSSPDTVIHVNDFGIEMDAKSCGLLKVHGHLKFRANYDTLSHNEKRLFLCSDLVLPESILSGGIELPVLTELFLDHDHETIYVEPVNPIWLTVNENSLQDVRLFIKDGDNSTPSVAECFLNCTLLVYKPNRK